jgi:hypothetical protein
MVSPFPEKEGFFLFNSMFTAASTFFGFGASRRGIDLGFGWGWLWKSMIRIKVVSIVYSTGLFRYGWGYDGLFYSN